MSSGLPPPSTCAASGRSAASRLSVVAPTAAAIRAKVAAGAIIWTGLPADSTR